MSKAVMLSIRPKWCEKICSGEKTIEVRKTRPKLETPFKVYIYCTLPKYPHEDFIATDYPKPQLYGGGKVIGEFTCDRIDRLVRVGFGGSGEPAKYYICNSDMSVLPLVGICEDACLTKEELEKYIGGHEGFGWHISNLKIYDTPKELIEFHTWKKCKSCSKSGYESTACIYDENCMIPAAITKAPQTWCYVEEDT